MNDACNPNYLSIDMNKDMNDSGACKVVGRSHLTRTRVRAQGQTI